MNNSFQLDFFLGYFPELLTVEATCDALDGIDHKTAAAWLDEGILQGVDIRSKETEKRCLRIWKYSIEHYMVDPTTKPIRLEVAKVMKHGRIKATFGEVAVWLSCSKDHIEQLHTEELLAGPRYSKRSGRVLTDSLHQFLDERWIS